MRDASINTEDEDDEERSRHFHQYQQFIHETQRRLSTVSSVYRLREVKVMDE